MKVLLGYSFVHCFWRSRLFAAFLRSILFFDIAEARYMCKDTNCMEPIYLFIEQICNCFVYLDINCITKEKPWAEKHKELLKREMQENEY